MCASLGAHSASAQTASADGAAAAPAPAAASPAQGDPHRGKQLSYTCLGCHGVDTYKNAYPNYSVPKLEGQHPEYLIAALQGYRSGDRSHITMHSQATTLSDQDIVDIASYFAGKPLVSVHKANGTPPQAAALCVTCHGQDGVTIAPMYPSLAGQHADYLTQALEEYKKGGRKNPIMVGFVANLKESDIEAIAEYFSKQSPSLHSEPRPSSSLTAEAEHKEPERK
ncbi:MAG TPA: cytochrome c [Steroidobacteraceae bacterium]